MIKLQTIEGNKFKKNFAAVLVLVILAMVCLLPVYAEEPPAEEPKFAFELAANGEESIEASTGDIITVTLKLKRTDQDTPYTMYAMQDELQYDSNFFELVEEGITLKPGITSTDIANTDENREVYVNFLSMSGGAQWNATEQLASIQFRVIGESGVAKITSNDFLVSQKDGYSGYSCESNEVTVVVSTECTVKFESRGGDEVPPQHVQYGEKVTQPQQPSREGYQFQGWYADIDLKDQWNFEDDVVKKNLTLYGAWKEGTSDEADTKDAEPAHDGKAFNLGLLLLIIVAFLLLLWLRKRKAKSNHT